MRAHAGIHRHARAFGPAPAHRSRTLSEGQPGCDHRSDRPGRYLVRADRRRRAWRDPPPDRGLERQSQRSGLLVAQRRRLPRPARSGHHPQRRLPGAAGHTATARGGRRPAACHTRRDPAHAGPARTGAERGRGRHVQRADLHARDVRRHRGTRRAVHRSSPRPAGSTRRTPGPTAPVRSRRTRR